MSGARERRPLIVSDCDEVLLHMVVPFAAWLDEARGIHFDLELGSFAEALRHKHDDSLLDREAVWPLLDAFFNSEMHRQRPIEGAVKALAALSKRADIAILTNLLDHRADSRAEQLRAIGIDHPVHCNQGGKGRPLAGLVADYDPSVTVFIDDLANHHESVAKHAPDVWRLHMVGEPKLARHIAAAPDAHARIDRWADALTWIEARIADGPPNAQQHSIGAQHAG